MADACERERPLCGLINFVVVMTRVLDVGWRVFGIVRRRAMEALTCCFEVSFVRGVERRRGDLLGKE